MRTYLRIEFLQQFTEATMLVFSLGYPNKEGLCCCVISLRRKSHLSNPNKRLTMHGCLMTMTFHKVKKEVVIDAHARVMKAKRVDS